MPTLSWIARTTDVMPHYHIHAADITMDHLWTSDADIIVCDPNLPTVGDNACETDLPLGWLIV